MHMHHGSYMHIHVKFLMYTHLSVYQANYPHGVWASPWQPFDVPRVICTHNFPLLWATEDIWDNLPLLWQRGGRGMTLQLDQGSIHVQCTVDILYSNTVAKLSFVGCPWLHTCQSNDVLLFEASHLQHNSLQSVSCWIVLQREQ